MHEYMCAKSLSRVWLFAILWIVACQAPLSMGFSRQEYQSGLSCPPPGGLPDLGIEDTLYLLHLQAGSLLLVSPGKPSRDDGSLHYFKHHLGHEYMVVSQDCCSVVALKTWGHLCISHVWVEEKMPFVSTTLKRWTVLCFLETINYTWIKVLFVSANNELCKVDALQHFCSVWHP